MIKANKERGQNFAQMIISVGQPVALSKCLVIFRLQFDLTLNICHQYIFSASNSFFTFTQNVISIGA